MAEDCHLYITREVWNIEIVYTSFVLRSFSSNGYSVENGDYGNYNVGLEERWQLYLGLFVNTSIIFL